MIKEYWDSRLDLPLLQWGSLKHEYDGNSMYHSSPSKISSVFHTLMARKEAKILDETRVDSSKTARKRFVIQIIAVDH